MDSDLQTELAALQTLVEGAGIPDSPRQTIFSSLKQLPTLYQEMMKTYESRYVDKIVQLVTLIRQALGNNGALELGEIIANRFTAMHSRRGFPSLGLKPAATTSTKRPKPKAK
jgi:hypothetical protein